MATESHPLAQYGWRESVSMEEADINSFRLLCAGIWAKRQREIKMNLCDLTEELSTGNNVWIRPITS